MNPNPATPQTEEVPSTENLVVTLLLGFMNLQVEQVVVYNQEWAIPSDDRLYIAVSFGMAKVYSATSHTRNGEVDGEPVLLEDTTVSSSTMIGIDVYSKNADARRRRDEIVMAFTSQAAQQMAERWALCFAQIPRGFIDLSGIEGAARLNRYHIDLAVLRTMVKTTSVEFFDNAPTPALILNP